MAKYLVTGGGGFIGSNIVEYLVERGETIRVLDNFSTGSRANLSQAQGRIALCEGDITRLKDVREAVEGVDFVLHQAALPSVPRSFCCWPLVPSLAWPRGGSRDGASTLRCQAGSA